MFWLPRKWDESTAAVKEPCMEFWVIIIKRIFVLVVDEFAKFGRYLIGNQSSSIEQPSCRVFFSCTPFHNVEYVLERHWAHIESGFGDILYRLSFDIEIECEKDDETESIGWVFELFSVDFLFFPVACLMYTAACVYAAASVWILCTMCVLCLRESANIWGFYIP